MIDSSPRKGNRERMKNEHAMIPITIDLEQISPDVENRLGLTHPAKICSSISSIILFLVFLSNATPSHHVISGMTPDLTSFNRNPRPVLEHPGDIGLEITIFDGAKRSDRAIIQQQ